MKKQVSDQLVWWGSMHPYIDVMKIDLVNEIVIGRYGGNSRAGAYKNEDGCVVFNGPDWELVVIVDGHDSDESTQLIVTTLAHREHEIEAILNEPVSIALKKMEEYILTIFQSAEFKESCRQVTGEAACLLAIRKENYFWWLLIGDCLAYVFHPELHQLGQYTVNQRHFYEWIGKVNTFERNVPGYSSGIVELRPGKNQLLVVTDGVIECANRQLENSRELYKLIQQSSSVNLESVVSTILQHVHNSNGKDSATLVYWEVENTFSADYAGNQSKGEQK
ncbi:protein phosphatase 2C domain-containing protein [Chryseomicrobium palamuruense]|uniref:Protein phosphatase 2C domain-containing protein n=1 Tax=Chryseomicrobium palamuruense TaxID=682973 RepID=A0ABV8UY59_9BACL